MPNELRRGRIDRNALSTALIEQERNALAAQDRFGTGWNRLRAEGVARSNALRQMPLDEQSRAMFQDFQASPYSGFAGPAVMGNIKAFHGSPHSFDKFDMSRIGTGEGAQAYGHGLYFAENVATAKAYRDQLAGRAVATDSGSLWADKPWMTPDAQHAATSALQRARGQGLAGDEAVAEAARQLHDQMLTTTTSMRRQAYQDASNAVNELRGRQWDAGQGRMYEVNIRAKPEEFLDWDKPLSEQSPKVREALAKVPWAEEYLKSRNLTGGQIVPNTPEGAQQLRDAGIPGIRYLDQGSRGAGEGTYNYVTFRDDIIDILKKYGLAGLMAAGAGTQLPNEAERMAQTALDVIEAAFRKSRVYASGETIEAEDSQDALEALNDMLHGLNSRGIEYAHTTLALAGTVNMPDELLGHIKAMLAIRMCTEWETEPTAQLQAEASVAPQFVAAYYLDLEPASVDPGLLRMPSTRKYY